MKKIILLIVFLCMILFVGANNRQTKLVKKDSCIVNFNLSKTDVLLDTFVYKIIKTTVKWNAELSEIYILCKCENNIEFITCLDAENTDYIKYVLYKQGEIISRLDSEENLKTIY